METKTIIKISFCNKRNWKKIINMKKINKYLKVIGILAFGLLMSCENFIDINSNPDTTTQISASLLATNNILAVTEFSGQDGKVMVSANALPKYVGYANEGQLDAQYNLIGVGSFGGLTVLPNIDAMITESEGSISADSYKGIGHFLRAMQFYKITMAMGDVPYTETNQGADGLYKPSYDTQLSVFQAILEELELADSYLAIGTTFDGDPTPYAGDPVKWRRAANSFALKVLINLSDKTGESSLNVTSRFANIVSSGFILEESTGYFGLAYSSTDRHPLSGENDLFTSRTIPSSLLIDNLKSLNDRRMYYFAEPSAAQITGGLTETDPDAYVGVDVEMVYNDMNVNHSAGVYSLLNLRYLNEYACEPRILLSYADQQLILAEARILGWISGTSAQNLYESGVTSALTTMMDEANSAFAHGMGIDQAYIDGYFTGEAAFKATTQEQLEQIWMQRYILNFMQDATESFYTYRRTGYPDFPIDPATSLNTNNPDGLPLRWMYPASETTVNKDNLQEALDRQYNGTDEINKVMWLLQ